MTIREARLARGWSQEELAYRSLVSFGTVNRLENGHPVSIQSLRRVCQALEIDPQSVEGVNIAPRVKRPA